MEKKVVRINPKYPEDIRPHSRAKVVGVDKAGFILLEVWLEPGEGYCWECGSIAPDPDGKLVHCPVCGGFFND